uniref:Predicted protein n=1 Tax=Hordeum vulgare subsp. vulgare TaxID=112509 RepID=F2EC37_HORVV|nr:predicted protein [Hordeum vulgare subsp. vulgare]
MAEARSGSAAVASSGSAEARQGPQRCCNPSASHARVRVQRTVGASPGRDAGSL